MSKLEELLKFHNARLARELASRTTPVIVAESALTAFVALCAFLGNMLVCVAIARNSRLHTPTNMLIFALAMTDITMSVATMPLTVGVLVSGRWIYSKEVCQFQGSFPLTLAVISLQLMVVISVNRYLCVVKPSLYRRVFKTKKSTGFAVGVLCLACFPTLSPMFYAREGSLRKSVLCFCHGAEFYLRSLYGIGVYNIPLYHHVVPVLSYLFLGAEGGFSTRKQLKRRKPAANRSRARSESYKDVGRCSCWVLMLLVSYYDHRPNRHEQWCTNASETSVLLLRIVDLHVVSHKPGVVRAPQPFVSRRIQKNDHLQDCLTFFTSPRNLHQGTQI